MNEAAARALLGHSGRLRIGVNLGNAALVREGPDGLEGPVASIGQAIAAKLGLPLEWVRHSTGGAVLAAIEDWDIAFLAIDPARGDRVAFTQPYAFVEACIAVASGRPPATLADLAASSRLRVAHTRGAGYLGALRQTLPDADLMAFDTPADAVEALRSGAADACAGLRAALDREERRAGDLRVLANAFQRVPQAVAVPIALAGAIGLLEETIADFALQSGERPPA